jgi:hypothetical protein
MSIRGISLAVALTACAGGSAAVLSNAGKPNHKLTGSWDVSLSLERPYPLDLKDPAARRVCGTIAFVDASQEFDGARHESAGVYDIDLARIGLDWIKDTRFPAADALQTEQSGDDSRNPDSVAITLNPDSRERIELVGLYRVTGIDGRWTAQSPRGTASGGFTLRPHLTDRRQSTC